jgi:hypothetical protein
MTCNACKINNKKTGLKMSIDTKTAPQPQNKGWRLCCLANEFPCSESLFALLHPGSISISILDRLWGFSKGLMYDVCMKRPQWLQLMHAAGQHKPGAIVGTAVATQSCDPKHGLDRKAAEKNTSRRNEILHTIQHMDAGRGINEHLLIAKAKGRLTDEEEETIS